VLTEEDGSGEFQSSSLGFGFDCRDAHTETAATGGLADKLVDSPEAALPGLHALREGRARDLARDSTERERRAAAAEADVARRREESDRTRGERQVLSDARAFRAAAAATRGLLRER
jgi:hypothetical protein